MRSDLYSHPIRLNSVFLTTKKELQMKWTYLVLDLPKRFKMKNIVTGKMEVYTQPMEWAIMVDKDGNAFYATGAYENQKIHNRTKEWVAGSSFGQPMTKK